MPDLSARIPDIHEERANREPEWVELERGYGHETATKFLTVEYDSVNDEVRTTGPVVQGQDPHAPAP